MSIPLLLLLAAALGTLSFFEPCTIATHAVFSARVHARPHGERRAELLMLAAARMALAIGLLTALVAVIVPPAWGRWLPAVGLTAMASVYVVSRFVYLPVPHLEFWRLAPGGGNCATAVKLGLTLPACTLPLFVIVAAAAVTVGSIAAAAAAGALFASCFTLPILVTTVTGLSAGGQRLLSVSARAASYVTAVLLYGGAMYLAA
jgi:cytochrome c-type biogenesis protein